MAKPGQTEPNGMVAVKECTHCGSLQPGPAGTKYGWRRHPDSKRLLCGVCGSYSNRNGGELPELLEKEQQEEREEEEEPDVADAVKQCSHCGSLRPGPTASYLWRRHPTSKAQLCGPCGRFAYTHDGELPELLATEEQQPDQQHEDDDEEQQQQQPSQRQCLQCGSTSKGSTKTARWHRHPATGEEWLCQPCFSGARAALKRQKRQAKKQPQQEVESEVDPEEEEAEGEEQSEEEQPQQQPQQRQCLQCGSTSKGSTKSAGWHRHPATGEEWMCQPCFSEARAALLRQQRQAEKQPQQHEENEQQEPEVAAAVRQCTHCGALQPGPTGTKYQWRRHPTTRLQLCAPAAATPTGTAAGCRSCWRRIRSRRGRRRRWRRRSSCCAAIAAMTGLAPPPPTPGASTTPPVHGCARSAGCTSASTTASCRSCRTRSQARHRWRRLWRQQRRQRQQRRLLAGSVAVVSLVLTHPRMRPQLRRWPPPAQTTRRQQAGAAGPAAVPGGSRRHGRPPKRKLLPGDEGLPPPAKQLHRHQAQAPAGAAESPAAAEKGHLDLLDLLVEASNLPAAAAAGLGGELVGGFWALMLTLSPEQQAAREAPLRRMLGQGNFGVAAGMMQTGLRLGGAA